MTRWVTGVTRDGIVGVGFHFHRMSRKERLAMSQEEPRPYPLVLQHQGEQKPEKRVSTFDTKYSVTQKRHITSELSIATKYIKPAMQMLLQQNSNSKLYRPPWTGLYHN